MLGRAQLGHDERRADAFKREVRVLEQAWSRYARDADERVLRRRVLRVRLRQAVTRLAPGSVTARCVGAGLQSGLLKPYTGRCYHDLPAFLGRVLAGVVLEKPDGLEHSVKVDVNGLEV